MLVPTRNYQSPAYRYGFQGQEKDDEIKGSGNSINYKFRMHDPRVGRFFAVDPLFRKYPHNSTYAFSENRVLDAVELEGLEAAILRYGARPNRHYITADTRTSNQRASDSRKGKAIYDIRNNPTLQRPPSERIGTPEGSAYIMKGVAYGMLDVATGEVIGKVVQGAKSLKRAKSVVDDGIEFSKGLKEVSPKVQKAMNTLKEVEGAIIKPNKLKTSINQEINYTIKDGKGNSMNLRIETHKVPTKFGGNGKMPQRHMNVETLPSKKNKLPNKGHVILE